MDDEDVQDSTELPSVPYVPEASAPVPIVAPEPADLSEPDRQRAVKRSKLRLEQATTEVERLKPTTDKLLSATGLNLRESAAGSTKQALGNVIRSYTDIVAPATPHEPGSFQYYLQFALKPSPAGLLLSASDRNDPSSLVNVVRETGKLTAGEGTSQLKEAQEQTEQLGGGQLVSGAASLASTAGSSAPALLAAPLGLAPAAIAAGLQSYGQNIDSFKEKLMGLDPKLTEQQAFDKAMLPAAITGAATAALTRGFGGTERLIEQITTKGLAQTGVKGVLRDLFKSAALEFPEEYLDQLSQGFTEKAFVDPNKDVGDIFNDAAMAGLQGFTLGGITGAAIHGVAHGGTAAAGKIEQTIQRSKVRQALGPEGNAAIRRVIETKGQPNAEGEISATGRLPAQQGQPAQAGPEVPAETGAAQRSGPGGEGQAVKSTTDVVQHAIEQVFPKPAPAPAPKNAVFGGYLYENPDLPTYKIPGVREGIMRDVSADTARKLGYTVPEQIPTFDQWKQAGSPTGIGQAAPPTQTFESRVAPSSEITAGLPPVPTGHVRLFHGEGGPQGGGTGGAFYTSNPSKASTFGPDISWVDVPVGRAQAAYAKAKASAFSGGDNFILEIEDLNRSQKIPRKIAPPTYNLDDVQYSRAQPLGTPQNPINIQIQKADGTTVPAQFTGYYDYSSIGKGAIPSVGKILPNGQVSHGMLGAGETIIGEVPSFEQWQTSQMSLAAGTVQGALDPTEIATHLQQIGIGPQTQITVVNDPNADWDARSIFAGREIQRIELNAAKINSLQQVDSAIEHELSHVVSINGAMDEVLNSLSDNEKIDIMQDMIRLGYTTGLKEEIEARGTEKLVNAWKKRTWFQKLIGHVLAVAKKLGFNLNRLGAEQVAARAVHAALQNALKTPGTKVQGNAEFKSMAPNLSQAQIQGGAAEIGRIADEIYSHREQGISALEGLAYERKQFKTAASEIKRLNDLALAGYIQQGLDPDNVAYPDATAGVGITDGFISADSSFTDALQVAGVPHNAENVQHMQEELFFERAAQRYNKLQQQTTELASAVNYYEALGVDPAEITKINQELATLEEQKDKLGSAELSDRLVSDRAGEMTVADGLRQERIAQRNSLSLEPVADFFGRQVGAYREFSQKAKEALAVAQAVRNAATNPEALRLATLASDKWLNLPTDIRSSILTGRPLTTEQKSVIFSALGQTFEEFDFAHQRMTEQLESRIPEINTQIRDTLLKVAKAKVQSGMGQVLLSDVLSTLDGESGATGNLKSLAETQALRERTAAIESFAMALGNHLQENKQLFEWLSNPSTPKPIIPPGVTMGADPATVEMILNEVQRNPAFGSSVLTLIQAANKKLANMPITGLSQIEELLKEGTPEAQNQAEEIARGLRTKARAQVSLGASNLRESLSQLDALEIERRSLQEGQAMFAQMEASPEFRGTRDAVQNSPFGLVEPMVPQNHVATTFKAFGAPGLPSHPELVLGADRDINFKADWFKKVAEWRRKAQEYLDAYDMSAALYHADPVNNPSPQSLGFDIPKVRGLRDATQRFVSGSFLELSLNTEGGRWKVPWLARALSRTALFRQHDFVSKMVGGVTGTDLRARLGDFVNHYLTAQGIRDKYKDIPDKLHKALRSHPEFGMNIANYREFWNEMAHWGRMFGSPLKAGMVLPRSGRVVNEADMALLQRERAYEEELRRRVTETNVTQGIRVKVPGRELVRPGAYVGDEGLPRFPGRRADSFIADSIAAYGQPVTAFGPTTNLGFNSSDLVVQFWNRNPELLVQHILDARRTDRQMVLTPGMQQAESDLAAQWIVSGAKPAIGSLEDLVNELVKTHPPVPGLSNVRDLVVQGLNAELRQYRDAAQRIATDRAERDQARQSKPEIAFSAENEFTKPAAKLELPSALYDYGALSPGEHLALSSRSNHERIIAYATAVNRAIVELESRSKRYESGEIDEKQAASSYGGDVKAMRDVLGILKKVQADFQNAYATGSFTTAPRGLINDTLGVLTSAILALPTVGLRNMTQGQFEVYAMSRAMGTAGHWMTLGRTLKAVPKTLIRFALHLGDGIVRRTNLGAALLTGKNHHLFEDFVHKFGNMIAGEDFRAVADKIGELGMDGRDSFLQRLKRIWQETSEFVSREDIEKSWQLGGHKVGATAAIPAKVARALFDKIGVQQYDFAINTAALSNAELLASRLKQVADVYGKAREGLGPFDPTNRAFDLKPSEWGSGKDAEDTLAQMRQVLETSASAEGFQLEQALWNFYQKKKSGMPNPQMFTDRQMDAVQRRILADMNASTPANRPSSASANGVVRNLLLLQGYPSDMLLKIINSAWGSTQDRGTMANAIVKTPTVAMLALVAILIGYLTSAVTGQYEKRIRGRIPSLATPLDMDFYTNWKRFAEGTLALGAAQFGYLGDIVLALMGEVRGNRGFDPTGRILGVSLVTRALTALRGAYNTAKAGGTLGDTLVPVWDVGRSMVPFWLEAQRVLGGAQGAVKQAERVLRGEAQTQGLLEGRSGFQPPTYGPTTVFRRNLGDAVSKWAEMQQAGNQQGAAVALTDAKAQIAKLEEYHYQKYIAAGKDPATARQMAQRDIWNDYQDVNPAVAAMLGKRPTQAQYDLLRQGTTGDRGAAVDAGIKAWQGGAMALFNRPGTITREESAAARGGVGSGGRGFSIPGVRSVRFPGLPGSRRRAEGIIEPSPVRGVRSRVRRASEAPLRSVRAGTRSVQRLVGAPRNRRRVFGQGPPRFRTPRVGPRRSRRRRDYVGA